MVCTTSTTTVGIASLSMVGRIGPLSSAWRRASIRALAMSARPSDAAVALTRDGASAPPLRTAAAREGAADSVGVTGFAPSIIICICRHKSVYADIALRSTAPGDKLAVMTDPIVLNEVANCMCLRARRVTRRLTHIYDTALEPIHLTANQFGVLSFLYGPTLGGRDHVSIGALAERVGKHPTTLNRDLKPLEVLGLVASVENPADRRVRAIQITSKGRTHLRKP